MAFEQTNQILIDAISQSFNLSQESLLVANIFVVTTVLAILIALIALFVAIFFDFISDVWKIPIAMLIDAAKYFSLSLWWFSPIAAITGFAAFLWLSDARVMAWPFAILSVIAAIVPWVFGASALWVVAIAIFPINTIMMFVATIVD